MLQLAENAEDLKKFWHDVADGIYSSAIGAWQVDKLNGALDGEYAALLIGKQDMDQVKMLIKKASRTSQVIKIRIINVTKNTELVNGEFGNSESSFTVNDMIDLLSSVIDDNVDSEDIDY